MKERYVVQSVTGEYLPVVALYDKGGKPTTDPVHAYHFDIRSGIYTVNYDVPFAPNPDGFIPVQ